MKLTAALERVLQAFLADPSAHRYGYDLMRAARLPSGTLYPMLARLQDQGLVTSEWEPRPDGDAGGRPPRKYYRLTAEGVRVARLEMAQAAAAAPRTAPRLARGAARPVPGSNQ
jgi:DNA-binding PadR family transcriptional regulator